MFLGKNTLLLGQLFSEKIIIFLRYLRNLRKTSVISFFSAVICNKCFFFWAQTTAGFTTACTEEFHFGAYMAEGGDIGSM